MVPKRHLSEEDSSVGFEDVPFQGSKRRLTFETVVKDVMKGLSMQEFVAKLEPILRRAVRTEVEHVILPFTQSLARPLPKQNEASGSRGLQLHFRNKMPQTLFTGNRVESVEINIVDANSKSIVTCGPLSSIKIEILVLDGDFGSDEKEDWVEGEFDASVIREREGKRPLVIGELQTTLRNGVGYFGDITFTDNSSWIRSRTFRLGARVVRSSCNEARIREARSDPFVVKDHRGELYKKHHPPSLGDEVWRLEKIGKDGAFHTRLSSKGIETVEGFLKLLSIDPSALRSILGGGMSAKTWNIIVQHARSCTLDNKKYMYYNPEQQQLGLVFNSIYKVIAATFDGHNYQTLDNLGIPQILVENVKQQAYSNLRAMVEVSWPSVEASSVGLPLLGASFPGSNLDRQVIDCPITHQDQPSIQASLNPTNALPYASENHGQLQNVTIMHSCHPIQMFSQFHRNSFKMKGSLNNYVDNGNQWITDGSPSQLVLDGHFAGDEISLVQSWPPVSSSWGQGNGYFIASADESGISYPSSFHDQSACVNWNPNMGWTKLIAVVKCGLSVRKMLAAKRMAKCLQLGYQHQF